MRQRGLRNSIWPDGHEIKRLWNDSAIRTYDGGFSPNWERRIYDSHPENIQTGIDGNTDGRISLFRQSAARITQETGSIEDGAHRDPSRDFV